MKTHTCAIVAAILALGVAAPAASAQDGAPGKGRQHQGPRDGARPDMTAPLLKGITLSAEQQKKVDAINADMHKQIQALSPEERRTQMREIMQTRSGKVREVLTADQQKVFDQNVKAMQGRFQGKGGPGGKGPPGKAPPGKGKGGKKPKDSGGDE
jgi:Spy/CpxP family protein refolding chaperone